MLQPELDKQEFGYWFEGQWLSMLRKSGKCYSHPLLDTRSAGNIVNPQPSDILSIVAGKPVYQECKTSTDYTDFGKCYKSHIRANQAAACRVIEQHKGIYVFPFLSRTDKKLYVYDGFPVVKCYHRKSTDFPRPMIEADWKDRASLVDDFLDLIKEI